MAIVRVHILLCGPTELTMINDIILAVFCSKSILRNYIPVYIFATDTETDIANNKILRSAAVHFIMGNDDTHSGCCLTGDSVVPAIHTQVFDQTDLSGDRKTNRQRRIGVLFHRPAKRTYRLAVSIVRKCGHIHHFTATTTGGVFTKSLCAGERHERIRQKTCRGY